MEDHLLSSLSSWLDSGRSLDTFPHQLFSETTQTAFFQWVYPTFVYVWWKFLWKRDDFGPWGESFEKDLEIMHPSQEIL